MIFARWSFRDSSPFSTCLGFQVRRVRGQALAAPQAALISSIAQGVLGGNLPWNLIYLGMGIGVVVVIIDEVLRRSGRYSVPPLAVGMGMYLPIAVTTLIPLGAFIGYLYNRWAKRAPNPAFAERLGVLMATGLIVGESLFGVALPPLRSYRQ